jgi:transposase
MSKHTLVGGDGRKLLDLLARLKTRAEQRIATPVKVVTIHEVGLDGFWIHRLLEANGVESHVVNRPTDRHGPDAQAMQKAPCRSSSSLRVLRRQSLPLA